MLVLKRRKKKVWGGGLFFEEQAVTFGLPLKSITINFKSESIQIC